MIIFYNDCFISTSQEIGRDPTISEMTHPVRVLGPVAPYKTMYILALYRLCVCVCVCVCVSHITGFLLCLISYFLFFFFLLIFLAHSTNLPTGFYISISFFFKLSKAKLSQDLLDRFSRFFSPTGRYLRECCESEPVFPIPQGTLPWHAFIQHPDILKRIGILQYG